MSRRTHRGVTLIEIFSILVPAVVVFTVAIVLLARFSHGDRWQDARLQSLDSLLFAWERIRADLASTSTGEVDADGERLTLRRHRSAADPSPEDVEYRLGPGRDLTRNGQRIQAGSLDRARFEWVDEARGLLRLGFARTGGSDGTRIKASTLTLAGDVHLPGRAAATRFASWVD